MSNYNFDKAIDRRETHSYKWNVPKNSLSFSIADTDFMVADEIVESICERAKQSTFGYTYVTDEYFDAYVHWWKIRYNTKLKREWFVYSTGVVASIDCLLKLFTNQGDKIALFSPNYNVFYDCINNNNLKASEIPFDYQNYEYSIDWEKVENAIKNSKVFILCNPHNPTGKQFDKSELTKIVSLCKKYGVYLISDEIHADLDYGKKRYIPLFSITDYDKAIMLASPSKSFNLAGLHSSVIVTTNSTLREKIQNAVYHDDIGEPSYFSIDPVVAAYTRCEKYIDEENEYISQNKLVLSEFFDKNDIKLKILGGDATYLLWVDISFYSNDSDDFVKRLQEEKGMVLVSGKHYHEHYSSFVRINIATQRKNILQLCNSLREFLIK